MASMGVATTVLQPPARLLSPVTKTRTSRCSSQERERRELKKRREKKEKRKRKREREERRGEGRALVRTDTNVRTNPSCIVSRDIDFPAGGRFVNAGN